MKLSYRLALLGGAAALASYALSSCRGNDQGLGFVDPRLALHLSLGPVAPVSALHGAGSGALPLWRSGELQLGAYGVDGVAALRKTLNGRAPVMVSFARGSLLGEQLRSDPLTLAYYPATSEEAPGHALVAVTDETVLIGLASAAHTANNHACGNLELLPLTTLKEVGSITPPVFDEAVKLDSVAALVALPDPAKIGANVAALEALGTRYHTSDNAMAASTKVFDIFTAAAAGKIPGMTIDYVDHAGASIVTKQKSVVVTIPGSEDHETTVIVGAHLDSINRDGEGAQAPGADDDASGIATVAEILRSIAESGATFKRKIELHAYAAEEVGLVGSGDIAEKYVLAGRKIAAMFQLDMNSWSATGTERTIYLVENDTSRALRRGLKDILFNYLGGDFVETSLGGGTSDHKSWQNQGYPAVFPFENPKSYNRALHTLSDTSATINNLPLSARFAQLGLAFLAHHAGIVTGSANYEAARAALKTTLSTDLKLAFKKSADASATTSFSVTASGPQTMAFIHLCKIAAAGSMGCVQERVPTADDKVDGGRTFRAGAAELELADGDRLAVFGYDAEQKLIAYRSVRLKKK